MSAPRRGVVDRFGRRVPAEPVVALHVDRTPGRLPLRVDGIPVELRRGADPHRAGLAVAADRARVLGRPVRVGMSSPWSEWPLVVHPDGSVDDARDPLSTTPAPAARARAATLAGARDRPRRRPVGALAAACTLTAALLVGAVGTGVATLGALGAAPAACRPVTLFAMGGNAAGAGDTLGAVTDPLVQTSGDKLAVVTVPPPEGGADYGAAEQQAVTELAGSVIEQLAACPTGAAMLFGYSEGAHVAGDVAAHIGAGQVPGVAPGRILAVGLFGDPARSPDTRVVPDGASGQGILPPRSGGFGALDARTIQICAPGDPVCATTPATAAPTLEQALAAPTHASYPQLAVAQGTPATAWASQSLGRLIASLPPGGVGTEESARPSASSTTGAARTPAAGNAAQDRAPAGTTTPTPPSGRAQAPAGADEAPAEDGGGYEGGEYGGGYAGGEYGGPAALGEDDGGGAAASGREAAPATTTARTGAPGAGRGGTGTAGTTEDGALGDAPSVAPTTPPARSGSGTARTGTGSSTRRTGTAPRGDGSASTTTPAPRESGETRASTSTRTTPPEDGGGGPQDGGGTPDGQDSGGGGNAGRDTGADFAMSSGLEGWKSTPWNNEGAADPVAAESPDVAGREAIRFDMPGGGKRNEAEPDVPNFQEGQTAFIGYSGFFADGFPVDTDTWQLIMQFKQPGTGSPPLAVEVGRGQLRLANNGGSQRDFCPVRAGAPVEFRLRVTFGGTIDAYCGDQQTLADYATPSSNVVGSAYLKTGIYRDTAIGADSTLFLDDLKVGDSLASVSGLAGGTDEESTATSADTLSADTETVGTGGAGASRSTPAPTTSPTSRRPPRR